MVALLSTGSVSTANWAFPYICSSLNSYDEVVPVSCFFSTLSNICFQFYNIILTKEIYSNKVKTTILFYLNKYFLTGTTSSYEFNELQIYGKAQLAVLTDPVESNATIYFHNMIGDRSGDLSKNIYLDRKGS
jgi:hypothetical protein